MVFLPDFQSFSLYIFHVELDEADIAVDVVLYLSKPLHMMLPLPEIPSVPLPHPFSSLFSLLHS